MSEPRRVIVAVGPRIYREGLSEGVERRTSSAVSAAVACVGEAIKCIDERGADIVLLDIGLADADRFVRYLVVRQPAARVVALAIGDNEADVCTWASLGVAGFLTTADSLDDLVQCIAAVERGEFSCSPRHASMLLRRVATLSRDSAGDSIHHEGLTPRQAEIVVLMQARMSNKLIARQLGIELATVKNHVHQILHRLNLHSRVEVVQSTGPPPRHAATLTSRLPDADRQLEVRRFLRQSMLPSTAIAQHGRSDMPARDADVLPSADR
jgi:two-component system, NarL family, nitrate/nitrite response regulator NarL